MNNASQVRRLDKLVEQVKPKSNDIEVCFEDTPEPTEPGSEYILVGFGADRDGQYRIDTQGQRRRVRV